MSMYDQEGNMMSGICSVWLYAIEFIAIVWLYNGYKFNGKCIFMQNFLRCQNWVMQILYYWEKRNQVRENFVKDYANSTK